MKKEFQIKNVYLNKSYMNFINELLYLERKTNKDFILNFKIELKDIEFSAISEKDYLSHLGLSIKGFYGKENENIEPVFEAYVNYSIITLMKGYNIEEITQIQFINISSYLYPYIRSEMQRILADTPFPKIQLQTIDFMSKYYNKFKKEENQEPVKEESEE